MGYVFGHCILAMLSKSRMPTPDEVKTILLTLLYLAAAVVGVLAFGAVFGWILTGRVIG